MSQLTHPKPEFHGHQLRRSAWLTAALLAVGIAISVPLVMSGDDDVTQISIPAVEQSAARADGGPEETSVAAAVVSRPVPVRPEESDVAAAVQPQESLPTLERPDEGASVRSMTGR